MAYRKRIPKKKAKRSFSKIASKTHRKNIRPPVRRGGTAL